MRYREFELIYGKEKRIACDRLVSTMMKLFYRDRISNWHIYYRDFHRMIESFDG